MEKEYSEKTQLLLEIVELSEEGDKAKAEVKADMRQKLKADEARTKQMRKHAMGRLAK